MRRGFLFLSYLAMVGHKANLLMPTKNKLWHPTLLSPPLQRT